MKQSKKLLNANIAKKFHLSFTSITIGIIVTVVLAFANMLLLARAGGISIFTSFSRSFGVLLYVVTVLFTMLKLRSVAKSLSTAFTAPIYALQDAIKELKAGNFDFKLEYEGNDEFKELCNDLQEACDHMHTIVTDTKDILGKMAGGNFRVSSSAKEYYVGDFANQLTAMRTLKYTLSDTLHQIQTATAQVLTGSEQLAGSA